MIIRDWYIANERLGIACLTSYILLSAPRAGIRSSSIQRWYLMELFPQVARACLKVNFVGGNENNRSAVKSPLDWSWRMNTCLAMLRFQFQPRRHVLPRASSTWCIIVILPANRQILNVEIHFKNDVPVCILVWKELTDFSRIHFWLEHWILQNFERWMYDYKFLDTLYECFGARVMSSLSGFNGL